MDRVSPEFRAFWTPVVVATLVAAFFGAVLAIRGRGMEKMLNERAALETRLAELEQDNARLRAEREALMSSPDTIERVAREDYGFTAPNEKVSDYPAGHVAPPPAPVVRTSVPFWERAFAWRLLPLMLPLMVFAVTAGLLALLNTRAARQAK